MPTLRSNRPRVAVTIGDPSGIGPEVVLKALASPKVKALADFLIIGDGHLPGKARRDMKFCAAASLQYVDRALELIKRGEADCLVTAPVNKSSVRQAGFPDFQGHTEYLAEKTGTKDFAMMFVGENLKVVPVTRHIPLRSVPSVLSTEKVFRAIALTHRSLKKLFKIKKPKIGVAGLNPHAGERGSFGNEEARIISPAVRKASRLCGGVSGPVPADVLFYDALNGSFDAVVAMYHDQGLGPFKMLYFKTGVNLTLGLPFIRTSPDHGTAFDIAGKNIADPSSMIEAIRLACRLR